jgi:hypothetical protein
LEVIKSKKQFPNGGLASSTRSDESDSFPGFDSQRKLFKDATTFLIKEVYVVELDISFGDSQFFIRMINDAMGSVHDFHHFSDFNNTTKEMSDSIAHTSKISNDGKDVGL